MPSHQNRTEYTNTELIDLTINAGLHSGSASIRDKIKAWHLLYCFVVLLEDNGCRGQEIEKKKKEGKNQPAHSIPFLVNFPALAVYS